MTLKNLLHTVLRPVADSPEKFTFPKPLLVISQPEHSQESFDVDNSVENLDEPSESFWTRIMRFFLCGAASSTVSLQANPPSNLQLSRPPSSPDLVANEPHYDDAQLMEQHRQRQATLSEIALLSPLERQRLEVRQRLIDLASSLVEKLQDSSAANDIPKVVVMVIRTIRDIIISPVQENVHNTPTDDEIEIAKQRKRFEFGTFFTSCSALLFLRLICKAIISPDEYGVTENLRSHSTLAVIEWPHRGVCLMGMLAHVLACDDETITNNTKSIGHHHKEILQPDVVDDICSLSLDLKTKLSREKVLFF
jgi:hypothetical protein